MKHLLCLLLALLLLVAAPLALADNYGGFISNSGSSSFSDDCYGFYGMLLSAPIGVDANQRFSLRAGPATEYYDIGTFNDIRNEKVFVEESDGNILWVLVDFECSAGHICAYTGRKRIDSAREIPYGNKEGVSCRIGSSDAYAYYGPGKNYVQLRSKLPAGKRVTAYYEYNDYVMVEYTYSGDSTLYRSWVAKSALQ